MQSQTDPCLSSNLTSISASSSARSFEKDPARLLIFINSTVPGHKCSSVSRGTNISKCTMSRGCGWNSNFPHFMRISRRTKQSMKIDRACWIGNIARTRLKNCRRLAASARIEETGPPTGAKNCRRGFLSVPSAKPRVHSHQYPPPAQ
jgi:hypothetical protein